MPPTGFRRAWTRRGPAGVTVIVHSIVWQYLTEDGRARIAAAIGQTFVVQGEPERRGPDRLVWTLDVRPT